MNVLTEKQLYESCRPVLGCHYVACSVYVPQAFIFEGWSVEMERPPSVNRSYGRVVSAPSSFSRVTHLLILPMSQTAEDAMAPQSVSINGDRPSC
ncbi:unnamed protein product [Triticum turgidum subsp. durum]|uniref:Uncharacterized protein n=1 Tax=Triticum turgidum subsp. durum TaxID=4567 RepID=A0A9R0YJI1_TRITD|nr:unnamed protein product [Triticum turgidum subsp. durum]